MDLETEGGGEVDLETEGWWNRKISSPNNSSVFRLKTFSTHYHIPPIYIPGYIACVIVLQTCTRCNAIAYPFCTVIQRIHQREIHQRERYTRERERENGLDLYI